jgi:hypothetical protein
MGGVGSVVGIYKNVSRVDPIPIQIPVEVRTKKDKYQNPKRK